MSYAIDFEPSTEESSIVAFLRRVLEREWSTTAARGHATAGHAGHRLWEQVRDWDTLVDAGLGALCLAHEELGAALAPGHTWGANLAVVLLRRLDPQLAQAIVSDGMRATFAAPTTPSPADHAGGWVIEPDGADVVVSLEQGAAIVCHAPQTTALVTLDVSRRLGTLVHERDGNRVEAPVEAVAELHRVGALTAAADALGACRQLIEASRSHALARRQFGRPIASFQALAHRIVDMQATVQLARAALHRAVALAAANAPECDEAVHVAKAAVGDAVRLVSAGAVHVHGAMGYTWEHDVHLWARRAYLSDRLFGSGTSHELALSGALAARPSNAVHA